MMLFGALCLLGVVSYTRLSLQLVPDITLPEIGV